jgi:hypothetical protein
MPQCVELVTGSLTIKAQQADFPLAELCDFAARNNRKRGFLFISKVLGKHWPARPTHMRQLHNYLAHSLTLTAGPCLFIALAETATGLGQGVFEAVLAQRSLPALFLHSTRYQLPHPYLTFQEDHCHAPEQLLYEPLQPQQRHVFHTARELVLIDDEISTGATLCHLVTAYRAHNPHLERVHFVALTNFSGTHSAESFSKRVGLSVQVIAAWHGAFSFIPNKKALPESAPPAVGNNRCQAEHLVNSPGRFGIERHVAIPTADIARLSAGLGAGAHVLVLGTGEFMYLAFCVGLALENCGLTVALQATTRSPILMGAAIQNCLMFLDNYGEGIYNYLYNVTPSAFARIIICHETPSAALLELTQVLGTHCVTYSLNFPHIVN